MHIELRAKVKQCCPLILRFHSCIMTKPIKPGHLVNPCYNIEHPSSPQLFKVKERVIKIMDSCLMGQGWSVSSGNKKPLLPVQLHVGSEGAPCKLNRHSINHVSPSILCLNVTKGFVRWRE